MDSQIRISDLENIISEKVFIKIEKWNLYLGDAGLASPASPRYKFHFSIFIKTFSEITFSRSLIPVSYTHLRAHET